MLYSIYGCTNYKEWNMKVEIVTVPHEMQRYNTVGDYQTDETGKTKIIVSNLGDDGMHMLIALHELVESALCRQAGITDKMIDEFDFAFADNRAAGDPDEPGDDPAAPYYRQHQFATQVESMMAEKLGIDWDEYIGRITATMAEY